MPAESQRRLHHQRCSCCAAGSPVLQPAATKSSAQAHLHAWDAVCGPISLVGPEASVLGKLRHSCTHRPFKLQDRGLQIAEARADSMSTLGMVSSAALS